MTLLLYDTFYVPDARKWRAKMLCSQSDSTTWARQQTPCSAKQIPVDLPASNHLHQATVIDFEGKFVGCGEPGGQATANCLGGCVSRSIAVIPVSAAQAATSVSTVIKVWFSEVHASKDARKTIL